MTNFNFAARDRAFHVRLCSAVVGFTGVDGWIVDKLTAFQAAFLADTELVSEEAIKATNELVDILLDRGAKHAPGFDDLKATQPEIVESLLDDLQY